MAFAIQDQSHRMKRTIRVLWPAIPEDPAYINARDFLCHFIPEIIYEAHESIYVRKVRDESHRNANTCHLLISYQSAGALLVAIVALKAFRHPFPSYIMANLTIARVAEAAGPQGDFGLAGQILNPPAIKAFAFCIAEIEGDCAAAFFSAARTINLDDVPPIAVFYSVHIPQQPAG
jgi:hypothetical protein